MTPSAPTPNMNAMDATSAPTIAAIEPVGTSRLANAKSRAYGFLGRCAYWAPVFVVVVLFAQVSFLGLRPALCESQRLAEAEKVLDVRHAQATATNHEIAAHLSARQDPVFLERERRLRTIR